MSKTLEISYKAMVQASVMMLSAFNRSWHAAFSVVIFLALTSLVSEL
jgi:hypothetical protein